MNIQIRLLDILKIEKKRKLEKYIIWVPHLLLDYEGKGGDLND